jgi:hypothetical protein
MKAFMRGGPLDGEEFDVSGDKAEIHVALRPDMVTLQELQPFDILPTKIGVYYRRRRPETWSGEFDIYDYAGECQ